VASIFTGLEPEVHGAGGRLDRLGGGMPTLAERMAGSGWQTAAVVANPNASAAFGLDRGFGEFVLMPPERRESADVHAEVVHWLDRRDASVPFLLYVHTVDPHLPYDPPASYRERFAAGVDRRDLGSTENVGTLLARSLVDEGRWAAGLLELYDAEVAANDHAFGELLDELERRGLDANTVVIFLSDHGEEFFDHGGWIHGRTLYREVLQVPLVIRLAGQREGRRETAPACHIDLMPTILELAGLAPDPGLRGRSLLGIARPRRLGRLERGAGRPPRDPPPSPRLRRTGRALRARRRSGRAARPRRRGAGSGRRAHRRGAARAAGRGRPLGRCPGRDRR
jgi:arylsulfatase A-like enzyme